MFSKALQERIEELKETNDMYKEVIEDIISDLEDEETNEALKEALDQILTHGCISGVVNSMIYYSSTTAFYERHKETINEILAKTLKETELKLKDYFRKFDDEDPLCLGDYNQNLLAWFGYEWVAIDLYNIVEDYA